jgi:hypothetical protein
MKALVTGAIVAAAFVSPALADYYIVQDAGTKRCTIVEQRPAPGLGIVVGEGGFGARLEAENRMKTVEVCQDAGTTGERGGAIIERREERRER